MKSVYVSLLLLLQRDEPDRPHVGPLAVDLHHTVQSDRILPYYEVRSARTLLVHADIPVDLLAEDLLAEENLRPLEPRLRALLPIDPEERMSIHLARLPGRQSERLRLFYFVRRRFGGRAPFSKV